MGETRITGLLEGEDVLDTAKAMRAFGAEVTRHGEGAWTVHGVGVGGFAEPSDVIDCGNSGTGVRLIMGTMATSPISATFTGDASLRSRPMGRVTDPMRLFGAMSYGRKGGRLPLTLVGARRSGAGRLHAAGAVGAGEVGGAAGGPQRAGPDRRARGRGHARPYRTDARGLRRRGLGHGRGRLRVIRLTGQPELRPQTIAVPRDPSSAAFPVCAALITEGSDVLVPGIGLNPTRAGLYTTLREMGADLDLREPARGGRRAGGRPARPLLARDARDRGAGRTARRA